MVFDQAKLQESMKELGTRSLIATSHDNVYYCSGCDLETIDSLNRFAAVIFSLDSDPVFVVHAYEQDTARKNSWIRDLRIYKGGEWEPLAAFRFLADLLREKNLADVGIGIELANMRALGFNFLHELLPSANFVDCQTVFDKMRVVKSESELKLLSGANMATAKSITQAFEMSRAGDSEKKIARNMMRLLVENGADRVAFLTLGAGPNVTETHHMPGDYKIKKGDLVHTDFGGFFKGYRSDISRTAVVGRPNQLQLKAYDIAVGAEMAAADALREEATVGDVYEQTRGFCESRSYPFGEEFIGHSIGIGCHEYPFLGPSFNNYRLESNMFFQLEPFISVNGVTVHIEDSFIVGRGRARNVSEYRDISRMLIIK